VPVMSLALIAALAMIGWLLWDAAGGGCIGGPMLPGAIFGIRAHPDILEGICGAGRRKPWVIFSNAAFVGRPNTGMRYYDAAERCENRRSSIITPAWEKWLAVHSPGHCIRRAAPGFARKNVAACFSSRRCQKTQRFDFHGIAVGKPDAAGNSKHHGVRVQESNQRSARGKTWRS